MARRKHRRNPRAKYKVRHVVLKKNGSHRRRRRRNPADPLMEIAAAESGTAGIMAVEGPRSSVALGRPGRGFKSQWRKGVKIAEAKQRRRVSGALTRAAKSARKSAKRAKGATKRAHMAQAARLSALAAVVRERGRNKALKSPLIKAMTLRSNGSLIESAKIIAPVALVGAGGLVGLAMAGRKVADMIFIDDKTKAPKAGSNATLVKYSPALATAALSAVAFVVADKVAPRYKGAIAIGGMIGAIVQAVGTAAMGADDKSLLGQARRALSLGEYTTVGAGIFHGVGEYTTVGQAHPFRPRNFGDDQMEWAATGGLGASAYARAMLEDQGGADNASEFAPGEGGIFTKTPLLR